MFTRKVHGRAEAAHPTTQHNTTQSRPGVVATFAAFPAGAGGGVSRTHAGTLAAGAVRTGTTTSRPDRSNRTPTPHATSAPPHVSRRGPRDHAIQSNFPHKTPVAVRAEPNPTRTTQPNPPRPSRRYVARGKNQKRAPPPATSAA